MAGGRGARIAALYAEVPKPMIPIAGKPVLDHQLACLRRQGVTDITLIIGHMGKVIRDYFGGGVRYIEESEPLGTAGALFYLKEKVDGDFLLANGDIVFDIDIERFRRAHMERGGWVTLFTHPNDHPYDSGLVRTDDSGRVVGWLTKEEPRGWYKNRVNAGLHMMSPAILSRFARPRKTDLDRDILKPMIAEGVLYAYDSPEYVKDMGTPERFRETERDMLSGMVRAKNLRNRQRALFMDRDGVINKHVGFLRDIDEFELIDGAADIIRSANHAGYLVIVVTNQPVIARGEATWEQLGEIHNKMETLLGRRGAYVDDIFVCPHHPHKGFAGERPEYKIDCDCRKPKPGLLLQAAEKYRIDLSRSVMLGDSETDMLAGRAAGCRSVMMDAFDLDMLM